MDKIKQYYEITNVKPDYHTLKLAYYKPSRKRILFNGKELELHYQEEFQTYADEKEVFGGKELNSKKALIIVC